MKKRFISLLLVLLLVVGMLPAGVMAADVPEEPEQIMEANPEADATEKDEPSGEDEKEAPAEDEPSGEDGEEAPAEDGPSGEDGEEAPAEDEPSGEDGEEAPAEDEPSGEDGEEAPAEDEPSGEEEEEAPVEDAEALLMLSLRSAPAEITSADDLAALAEAVNGGDSCESQTITLATDIELTGEWTPIGTSATPFSGTFDGQGHTISELSINTDNADAGLFGYNAGTIKNLSVDGSITTTRNDAGGIVGYNVGTIENCHNDVDVTCTGNSVYYHGGIAGWNYGGTIRNCYNSGTISGFQTVGGIAGGNFSPGSVESCYNTGSVTVTGSQVGGIVGQSRAKVIDCYNVGQVSGPSSVGGIVGKNSGGSGSNNYYLTGTASTDAVSAVDKTSDELKALASTLGEAFAADTNNINNGYPVLAWQNEEKEVSPDLIINTVEKLRAFAAAVNGGDGYEDKLIVLTENLDLEGKDWTPIGTGSANSFKGTFDGQYHTISGLNVNATYDNAGLFGYLDSGGAVKNLSVKGSVTTTKNNAAGIVGNNCGAIENCWNAADVTCTASTYYHAGIAGYNSGTVRNCFNTGTIKGVTAIGGIAGRHAGKTLENCYNLGNISGTGSHIGGIVGQIMGSVQNCYNAGQITGGSNVGGVVGNVKSGSGSSNNYYLTGTASTDAVSAVAKTSDELKALAETLGSAFETNDGGYPALVWEKNIDTDEPVKAEFPEASELSAQLSEYIRAAINAKKAAENVPGNMGLLSTYTVSDTATDWIAVTMGRYGYRDGDTYKFLYDDGSGYTDYIAALKTYVTEKYSENNGLLHDKKATEWQRLILAVNAIGGDPTDFGTYNGKSVNLVKDGTYNHYNPGWQGINGSIFGLIALDTRNYDVPSGAVTDREKFIKDILALQFTDGVNGNEMGGWALSGASSDPDITAMAIQALAPYYNSETAYTYTNKALKKEMTQSVRQAVNAALDKLSALQRSDGDYASWGTVNAESTAQVLVALCSLGIDPAQDERFIKDGNTLLDGILKYRLSGGGFTHSYTADSNNPDADPGRYNYMATDQASYAMVAYWRFENGMRALYDMRDEWSGSDRAAINSAIRAIKAVPASSDSGYKAALKSALAEFGKVPESERRYVSNYNDLAAAIEIVGGRDALDTDDKYPVSMAITAPPTRTAYIEYETFDPAGMVVTLTYSDGSTEAVTDYKLQPTGELTLSVTEITVSCNGFTAVQKITVNEQAPWEGEGTQAQPYLIQDLNDLAALSNWVNTKRKDTAGVFFTLTTDIDMSELDGMWSSIGNSTANPFKGTFDGDGHCVKNYNPDEGLGFFDRVAGTVRNFGIASGSGALIDDLVNGKVINCWNAANITFSGGYFAAIVGDCRNGNDNLIEGCYNLGNVSNGQTDSSYLTGPLGGILGYCGSKTTVTIKNCYNMGDLTSPDDIGGIVGKNQGNLTIINCYNTGKIISNATNVNSKSLIHGLLGAQYGKPTITNSYYLADAYEIEMPDAVTIESKVDGEAKTADELKSAEILTALGSAYKADRENEPINDGYPVLAWQEFPEAVVKLTFSVTPADATVVVKNSVGAAVDANPDGTYTLAAGETYNYTVAKTGYTAKSGTITAEKSQTITVVLTAAGIGDKPTQDDPVKEHREKALASLEKQYSKFNSSDYSSEKWAALQDAYEKGIAAINAAEPADAPYPENNIIAALNAAIAAMQAVEPSRTGKITVAVSVDANTLGLGYIVKPTLVEADRYAKASAVLTGLLKDNGYSWGMTGSVEDGFYLVSIQPVEQKNATVAPFIVSAIGGEGSIMYSDRNDKKLSEFDYYNMSGWMYSVDGSFPGVGAASWNMTDGEVMRWQFTVYGYGADLNADNSGWGASSIIPTLGNKDKLTWAIAELRAEESDTELEKNDAYNKAMEVLQDPEATQRQIDAAYDALKDKGESSGGASGGPGSSVDVTAKPAATADKDGNANVTMEDKELSNIIDQAREEKADKIVIEPEVEGEASKVSVELPKSAVGDIVRDTDAALSVRTDVGTVTIPAAGLEDLSRQSGSKVTISAEALRGEDGKTSGETRIEVAVDGKAVQEISGGITVAVPAADTGSGNVLVLVNADGTEEIVKKSVADGKTVAGIVDGSCTVKVVDNSKHFDDTADHWSKDAVAFASSHELFGGTGENTFSPDTAMSRAMLATVLYRLEGAVAAGSNTFADVPDVMWYTDAVIWASNAGIVTGTGSGFDPNGNVTREQLATMLYRYAKVLGMSTTASGDLTGFSDSGKTSDWAKDAMSWAVGSGLISGKSGTVLDPTGTATRAEVAVIMQRLVGIMVK